MNNELKENVIDALSQIKPYLQRDGGDVDFVELTEDNIVKVKLQGHCAGCPHAQATLTNVIQRLICEAYPEVKGVEAV